MLLDIEGTTTPIAFVHDVLFPYARARVAVVPRKSHGSDDEIRKISRRPSRPAAAIGEPATSRRERHRLGYVHALIDRDRKSGPLKALQGRIWEQGYAIGELKGEVYPDVLRRPSRAGLPAASGLGSSRREACSRSSSVRELDGRRSVPVSQLSLRHGRRSEGRGGSYRRIVETLGVAAPTHASSYRMSCRSSTPRVRQAFGRCSAFARFPDSRTQRSLHRRNIRRHSSLSA